MANLGDLRGVVSLLPGGGALLHTTRPESRCSQVDTPETPYRSTNLATVSGSRRIAAIN